MCRQRCGQLYGHREGLLIMYQIDFGKRSHVHFIGIGGISMSGLAEILLEEGFTVVIKSLLEVELLIGCGGFTAYQILTNSECQ